MLLECCSGAALVHQIKLNETLLPNFFTFKLVTCVNLEYPIKPFFQTSAANESLRKELFFYCDFGPKSYLVFTERCEQWERFSGGLHQSSTPVCLQLLPNPGYFSQKRKLRHTGEANSQQICDPPNASR